MSDLNLDRILVTADLHLGHRLLCDIRGFCSIPEHDQTLIRNWNETVDALGLGKVTIYCLGDIAFRCAPRFLLERLKQLHGHRIILIRGNHDIRGPALKPKCRDFFDEVLESFMLKGRCEHPMATNGQLKVYMHHYAGRHWPSSCHGSINLHGHSHGKLLPWMRNQLDVGWDCFGKPITLRQALDVIHVRNQSLG